MDLRTLAWLTTTFFFAAMGITALVRPPFITQHFGIVLTGADAEAEVRAVYGGFGLAIAGLLLHAMGDTTERAYVAAFVAISTLGMAAGRLASALVKRPAGMYPTWTFVLVEIALAGLVTYGGR